MATPPPFTAGALERAARAFALGALEGFDPRLGDGVEIPAPSGDDTDARCAAAMPSVSEIIRDRQLTAWRRCRDLADCSYRLGRARAA